MIRCKIELQDIGNTCPVCGEKALDAAFDDTRDGYYEDTYKCEECGLLVTYVTKAGDRREYHEYRNGEIEVQLEWPFGHSIPDEEESPEARTGFYTDVNGIRVHVPIDPNLSAEERALVNKMILAAVKQMDEGGFNSDNPSSGGQ